MISVSIGCSQPLALLLKQSHDVTHLALYDLVAVPGVAADLSHVNTLSTVNYDIPDITDVGQYLITHHRLLMAFY